MRLESETMVAIRAHFDGKVIVPDEPVNLPVGRMTPAKAAECVKGLHPQVVYPYHFDNARAQRMENPKAAATEADSAANRAGVEEFKRLLAGQGIDVRIGAFYPTISPSSTH